MLLDDPTDTTREYRASALASACCGGLSTCMRYFYKNLDLLSFNCMSHLVIGEFGIDCQTIKTSQFDLLHTLFLTISMAEFDYDA